MSNWQGVYPSAGAIVGSRPTITVTAYVDESDIDLFYSYTITKGAVSYTDSLGVTTEFQGYAGPYSVLFSLPEDLEDGTWNIVSSVEYGLTGGTHLTGSPSASSTFIVTSVPSTILVSPASDYWASWSGTNHSLPLYWQFSSTSALDYQTAYQIIVRRFDNQTVVYDSGKVASSAQNAIATIPAAQKDVQLEWSVRTWNNVDSPTVYPAYRKVGAGTPPVSSISSPTENQVVNGAIVDLTTSATTTGGRTIVRIEAALWQGSTRLWSRTQTGSWASGQSLQITDNSYILPQSSQSYQYRVIHVDSIGLRSTQVVRNFTVTYTPPAAPSSAPTLNATAYDTNGSVQITWGSGQKDAAFYSWILERRHIELDPNTGAQVGSFSEWEEVGRVYDNTTSYEFFDFQAPSNQHVQYQIKQIAIRFGEEMVSPTTSPTAGVDVFTSSYWLITGAIESVIVSTTSTTTNGDAMRLYNVVGDSFSDEIIQNEFNLIGRGRYVEKGDHLGVKGALSIQLRDGQGLTARQKRLQLEALKNEFAKALMRNPFGDRYSVALGSMDVTRLPGTGKSEFTDVSMPYTEVVS